MYISVCITEYMHEYNIVYACMYIMYALVMCALVKYSGIYSKPLNSPITRCARGNPRRIHLKLIRCSEFRVVACM